MCYVTMLLEIDKENQDKRHLNTITRNTFYGRTCLQIYGLSSLLISVQYFIWIEKSRIFELQQFHVTRFRYDTN